MTTWIDPIIRATVGAETVAEAEADMNCTCDKSDPLDECPRCEVALMFADLVGRLRDCRATLFPEVEQAPC